MRNQICVLVTLLAIATTGSALAERKMKDFVPDAEPGSAGRILFVLTSHEELGKTGRKTGAFLSEVTHPYHYLANQGYAIDFASPQGGAAPIDPKSMDRKDPINNDMLDSGNFMKAIKNTMSPAQVKPEQYDAIYFAGGHGTMWDFPDNENLAQITAKIYEAGGVVGAVCHGPAGLVNVKLPGGKFLVEGRKLTAFTNAEEDAVELTKEMPFLLETKLKERGANFTPEANFAKNVIVDGRLVTGQNPASATGAAMAMHEAIVAAKAAKN